MCEFHFLGRSCTLAVRLLNRNADLLTGSLQLQIIAMILYTIVAAIDEPHLGLELLRPELDCLRITDAADQRVEGLSMLG